MKSIAVVLVLFLALGCQAATNCHWGPSYWCQSEVTAKECGGTEYCKENVWEKSAPAVGEPQNGIECELCTLLLNFIEEKALGNATEDKVKQALEEFCNSTGPLSQYCEEFVDENFDAIWQLLQQAVAPDQVCKQLDLCDNQEVPRPLGLKSGPMPRPPVKSIPVTCDVCKMVAKEVINLIDSNFTKTEAKVEIKKVCVYMGGFAPECRVLIDTMFDELWDAAMSAVGNTTLVCQTIKLCSAKVARTTAIKTPSLKAKDSPLCGICKTVVSFLKPFVDSDSDKDEVKSALDGLCAILPSSDCTGFVNTYFNVIWDLMKTEVDSGEVCSLIQLCNSSKTALLQSKPRPQPLPRAPTQSLCDICELAVAFLKPYVDSNATETEVKQALEGVCKLIPSPIGSECTDLVDDNFDTIWNLVKGEVDNDLICKQIGLCNSTKLAMKKTESSSEVCDACKMIVHYLKDIVDNNVTEDAAKAAVEALCDKAGPLKDECDALIDQYFPMIWSLMESYVDDDQICTEIKLCNSSASVVLKTAMIQTQATGPNSVGGGILCTVCEFVMKELTSMLDTNTTKQEIEDALDKVCSLLPSTISTECNEFVDKYAPEIIELILSGTAAKAVCTALGLCVLEVEELVTDQGTEECLVCKTVLDLVKTIIGSKSSEAEVSKVLEDVCDIVPSGIQSECKMFVDTFGPQLIELLDKEINPDTICRDIKLCASNVRLQDMVARKY